MDGHGSLGRCRFRRRFRLLAGGYFRLVLAPRWAGRRVSVGGMRVFAP